MNVYISFAVAAALLTAEASEKPLHKWTFDNADAKGRSASVVKGGKSAPVFWTTRIRPGAGVEASAGCHVAESKSYTQCCYLPLDSEAFTFDFRYSPDAEKDSRPRTLVSYSWQSWRRGQFQIKLLADNRLEISFYRPASKDGVTPLVDFVALSQPLKLRAGR